MCTCIWRSLLKADITHSDRGKTPASLGDGCSFGRAAITEALPAGTAVMLGVVILEDCVTLVAHLAWEKNNHSPCCIEQELKECGCNTNTSFIMRRANVDCVIGTPQTVNILVNMKVLTWPLVAGGKGWGCVCHSPRWGSWVSSRLGRSDLSAKRWRPWRVWHWALTQTGPLGWLHPEAAVQHCCCPLKSHLTARNRQVICSHN